MTAGDFAPVRQYRLSPPGLAGIGLTPRLTRHFQAAMRLRATRLDAGIALVDELEAELGPVTDQELEALRDRWSPQ